MLTVAVPVLLLQAVGLVEIVRVIGGGEEMVVVSLVVHPFASLTKQI